MSRILRRPMFRGGPVSSYGTGIASGLGYNTGGRVGYSNGGTGLEFLKKAFLGPRFTDPNYKSPMQFQSGTGFEFMSPERQSPGLKKIMQGPVPMDELRLDKLAFPATYGAAQEKEISESDIEMGEGDLSLTDKDRKGLTEFYEKLNVTEKPEDYVGGERGLDLDTKKEPNVVGDAKSLTTQQVIEQDAANNDDDIESMINRYEKLLGGEKARKEYVGDALAAASEKFFEGDMKAALVAAAKTKSKEPEIKRAAAMLGIKGEQAKDIYKIKLQNQSGQFQKKVEQIMKAKDLSLEKATNMALGLPGSIDTAVVEWKRKGSGLMTADDFDLLARGQNISKLPDIDVSQIEDGKYYVPGQKTIVTIKEKQIVDQQPYN